MAPLSGSGCFYYETVRTFFVAPRERTELETRLEWKKLADQLVRRRKNRIYRFPNLFVLFRGLETDCLGREPFRHLIKGLMGSGCSTVVEHTHWEQKLSNLRGRGFDSCQVLGCFISSLGLAPSHASLIKSFNEVRHNWFSLKMDA